MNAVSRAGFGAKKINMAISFIASCFDTIIYILVSAICVFDKTCRCCEQIPVIV